MKALRMASALASALLNSVSSLSQAGHGWAQDRAPQRTLRTLKVRKARTGSHKQNARKARA